ncbi:MAG: hypothetical protein U1A27_14970 [Phycisphaerae bacterium]
MAILSGTLSFTRCAAGGGVPKRLDAALVEKLAEHVIGKQSAARPDHVECGWVGGDHVLDRHFAVEKNVVGETVHFGLRIDTARCPADLMRAYTRLELDALLHAAGAERPTRTQRREARANAERRVEREVREGRFHRAKFVPVLIDSAADAVLLGSAAPAVFDQFHPLYHTTFGRRIEQLSAGKLAYRLAEAHGAGRQVEQAMPSAFVKHPRGESSPGVLWTQHDAASRDFLGNEFLLWLWWRVSEQGDAIALADRRDAAVVFLKSLTLECPWALSGKISILADAPTSLPEARRALRTGKLPRRAGLMIASQGLQFELSLSAETFAVTGAVITDPEADADDSDAGPDAIERVSQVRTLCQTLDGLFDVFLRRRLSGAWREDLPAIGKWLRNDGDE